MHIKSISKCNINNVTLFISLQRDNDLKANVETTETPQVSTYYRHVILDYNL